jgi:hypothetical protein
MLETLPSPQRIPSSHIAALERQVASVREAMFDVTDSARRVVAHEMTDLHVSLQRASNELGYVERLLRDLRAT